MLSMPTPPRMISFSLPPARAASMLGSRSLVALRMTTASAVFNWAFSSSPS